MQKVLINKKKLVNKEHRDKQSWAICRHKSTSRIILNVNGLSNLSKGKCQTNQKMKDYQTK